MSINNSNVLKLKLFKNFDNLKSLKNFFEHIFKEKIDAKNYLS